MSNFTDLDDAISDCWNIVTDIRNFVQKYPDDPRLKILRSFADVYDYKFDRMFDLSESCLRDYYNMKTVKPSYTLSDDSIERIAERFADSGGDIPSEKWISFARAVLMHQQEDLIW